MQFMSCLTNGFSLSWEWSLQTNVTVNGPSCLLRVLGLDLTSGSCVCCRVGRRAAAAAHRTEKKGRLQMQRRGISAAPWFLKLLLLALLAQRPQGSFPAGPLLLHTMTYLVAIDRFDCSLVNSVQRDNWVERMLFVNCAWRSGAIWQQAFCCTFNYYSV